MKKAEFPNVPFTVLRSCSEGFNLDTYVHLQDINSQAAEQRHSTLQKLHAVLHYMNFVNHLKLYTWFRNILLLVKHFPEKQHDKYKTVTSLFQ